MLGLLPDAVRESTYAAKSSAIGNMVYGGALCEAMHGKHRHKFSKLQPLKKRS